MVSKLLLPCSIGVENFGLTVVEEVYVGVADTDMGWRWRGRNIEDRGSEGGSVAEIVTEEAQGIEGGCEVRRSEPAFLVPADAVGGTVAGKSAERGGHTDRATGVRSDGSEN
jgi:hypothetical protein